MFDPIGGFDRMVEQFLVYLDTAYRIDDPEVSSARRNLLKSAGQLALDPIFETVPRYKSAGHGLEALIDDPDGKLPGFDRQEREAFVELALAGLFDRDRDSTTLKGAYDPYLHQVQMLTKGVSDGTPGIVTSGTGSGKTESFMLPILAQLAKEATRWPAPKAAIDDSWIADDGKFLYHRRNEHPARPKAIRALILYPLNALVEDQMVRLRKALDSPDAQEVMAKHFKGNRIFFGRYTGKSPVTGFEVHPRRSGDKGWKKRNRRARTELRDELRRYQSIHARLDASMDPDLRYIFPTTDGSELITRWDMQATPPDILVTNQSILNAMLVREVESRILEETKNWLTTDEDARFYLVLDELHLVRGSAGAEMAGMLKVLLERLGLADPAHAHKLRILCSSASLPMDEDNAAASLEYLRNMFGDAGTAGSVDLDAAWKASVVTGVPVPVEPPVRRPSRNALAELAHALRDVDYRKEPRALLDKFVAAARSISGSAQDTSPELMLEATSVASSMLDFAMQDKDNPGRKRPRSVKEIGELLFERDDRDAVRGLLALRAIPDLPDDVLPKHLRPSGKDTVGLPGFRMHSFVRNIEGLFSSVGVGVDGRVSWGMPSIERGQDYDWTLGSRKRLFEMLYCEACGDLYLGGKRGEVDPGKSARVSLLPAPQELEKLPESASSLRFEDASYREFALFWPYQSTPEREIRHERSPYEWKPAYLDPRTGIVSEAAQDDAVKGHLLRWRGEDKFQARGFEDDGTAVPFCCAKCGTDYSGRYRQPNSKKREGRLSPIRSFRTGFGKTSQLLATELVAALKSQGGDGKLVAFSDSREDAATLALDVEVQHQRDLRREILVTAATRMANGLSFNEEDAAELADLKAKISELQGADEDYDHLVPREKELRKRKAAAGHPPSVPLNQLFEFARESVSYDARPILSELMKLGSTPVEGADTIHTRVKNRPWFEFFDKAGDQVSWKQEHLLEKVTLINRAREKVQEGQPPEATDLLFSKTYFALEETGLGWPSFYGPQEYTAEMSRDDAMLRIFADAYRITPNQFQEEARTDWRTAYDMLGGPDSRMRRLLSKIFQHPEKECEGFLNKLRTVLRQTRAAGSIDISMLFFRAAPSSGKAWRCERCGRVHLHEGFGKCTRCGDKLTRPEDLTASMIAGANFLGRRVTRSVSGEEPLFRLKCEELTGQTNDPAERLQQFKGVFVKNDGEDDRDFEWRKLFDTVDLLSVTTTMEVGVDIGSLQAVYQGNMPPQRFNYQQRVGRAGRRGQAFSTVLTVCRSKSHDIHYFHNPIEITGSAPPPPFITTGLIDIPSRLLRKFWLVEAFEVLRENAGDEWAGDDVVPGDIHGEFLYCNEYFRDDRQWPSKLADALAKTDHRRLVLAGILADISKCEIGKLTSAVTASSVLGAIEGLREEFGLQSVGIAAALAERGMVPLYGMPTRTRNLYVDLKKEKGGFQPEWDTIDRDQDMAIFDFAPGSVRTREKLRHRCIGFTGVLPDIHEHATDFNAAVAPFSQWWKDDFRLRFCASCGAWSRGGNETKTCQSCGTETTEQGIRCVTPSAYRTEFRPTDENLSGKVGQRMTLASMGNVDQHKTDQNLRVNFAEQSEIFLVNPGLREESGFTGFDIQKATDTSAKRIGWWTKSKPTLKLAGQAISAEALAEDQKQDNRFKTEDEEPISAWLASTKITNSMQISPIRINPNLRLLDMDVGLSDRRDPTRTSVRAAAISATELLVQRAALDLDIAPEEFDALAPNIMMLPSGERLPYLQISDALPNGSGFCRHLLGDSTIPVSGLIKSILDDASAWPRTAVGSVEHMGKCGSSCYRCVQRYNNRNFHGLLDWRLGLSYLRAISDPSYECGFDGNTAFFELCDWGMTSYDLAQQTRTFIPGNDVSNIDGRPDLATFSLDDRRTKWGVVVHPLWDTKVLFAKLGLDRSYVPVDSFELSRRPLIALQRARSSVR